MAEYQSAYTGEEIDAGIAKANSAVQPSTLQQALANYQELLVSGTNIKTINNNSILGEGNIDIQGGSSDIYECDVSLSGDSEGTKVYFTADDLTSIRENLPMLLKLNSDSSGNEQILFYSYVLTIEGTILYATCVSMSGETMINTLIITPNDTSLTGCLLNTTVIDLSNYQEKLVSGSNIKTVNGSSILGSGNLAISPIYEANITLAADYSKMYFTADDLTYLKNNEPPMIKAIWDDGQGHSGSFVMILATTQEDGQANMPRKYTCTMIEEGSLNMVSVKIDGGYTAQTGCPLDIYPSQT